MPTDQTTDPTQIVTTQLIEPDEGFSSTPYQDSAGTWTIGWGSTRDASGCAVCATTPAVSAAEAQALVARDVQSAIATVQADVHVALTPDQEAALADFVYNLGSGAFASSTLLRLLNAGDYAGAAGQFDLWDHAGGVVLAGLLRRRQAEEALFQAGQPSISV